MIFFADIIHAETDFGADYGAGFDDHFPGDISTIDGASKIATPRRRVVLEPRRWSTAM